MKGNSKQIEKQIRLAKMIDEDIKEYESYDVEQAYTKIERRILFSIKKQRWLSLATNYAAILSFPLLISILLLFYIYSNEKKNNLITFHEVVSSPGVITHLELPDGSKVWLNASSKLRYPSRFVGKERSVYLDGEGYFEVISNTENPFYVDSDQAFRVRAYGTSFNVSAYNDDEKIEAILVEGFVDLVFATRNIPLKAGQMASFSKEDRKMNIASVNTTDKISWKEGRLVFRNASIHEVVRKLSRKYNVNIMLHENTDKDYRFRASFTNETISQIMDYLKLAAPIEWKLSETEQEEDLSYGKQRIELWIK